MEIVIATLLTYIIVGIGNYYFGPIARWRREQEVLFDKGMDTYSRIQVLVAVYVLRAATLLAIALLWPFRVYHFLRKSKPQKPKQEKSLYELMGVLCENGCETDEIPGGYGEFGRDNTNPIPTNTVYGSTCYLAMLRSPDGAKVNYEREGSSLSPVTPHPIDIYTISHPDGRRLARLYLSPYHKRTSEKAPKGFTFL